LVLDAAVHHGQAFAAGAGHRCASGVGLEGSGVGEAGSVVTDFGEHPGAGERSKSWQAGDDLGVRVLVKMVDGGGGQLLSVGAGGVECAEQGEGLAAEGVLLFSTLDRERAFVRQAPSGMRKDLAGVSHHPGQ
jgi:hypothetical protein